VRRFGEERTLAYSLFLAAATFLLFPFFTEAIVLGAISFVLGLLALGALAAFIFMKDTLLLLMCFMGLASSAIVFSIGLLSILFKTKVVEKFPNTIGTKSS